MSRSRPAAPVARIADPVAAPGVAATRRHISVAAFLVATIAFLPPKSPSPSGAPATPHEPRHAGDAGRRNRQPGMLWVLDGEALWAARRAQRTAPAPTATATRTQSMKGVAARYPAFDARAGVPVDLEAAINMCRTEQQKAPALAYESKELLALTAYVAHQSRGMPIESSDDEARRSSTPGARSSSAARGSSICPAASATTTIGASSSPASPIPQGHPTGYPLYRLEWQTLGSLQRRLRNCMIGMRAEPYAFGSPEHVALELYLMWRARGLPVETPAVRP